MNIPVLGANYFYSPDKSQGKQFGIRDGGVILYFLERWFTGEEGGRQQYLVSDGQREI